MDLDFLQSHSLFGGFEDDELREIGTLLTEELFPAGADIVREGGPGERLFFISDGCVEVLKQPPGDAAAKPRRIALLESGDTFGEMEFIDVQPCAATVRAVTDTTVLELTSADLYHISKWNMKTYAKLVMNMAREISRRLRHMDALVAAAPSQPAADESA